MPTLTDHRLFIVPEGSTARLPVQWRDNMRKLPYFQGAAEVARMGRPDVAQNFSELFFLDVRELFPDEEDWTVNTDLDFKRLMSVHHDALVFSAEDQNFSGTTIDEVLTRLSGIYNWHTNLNSMRSATGSSWNGIGYHIAIAPDGLAYVLGNIDTHRAHTKGNTVVDGGRSVRTNRIAIGVVLLGLFMDDDRPTRAAIKTLSLVADFLPTVLDRPIEMHPHKYFWGTACPGDWVTEDEWGEKQQPLSRIPVVSAPVETVPSPTSPPLTPTPQEGSVLEALMNQYNAVALEMNQLHELLIELGKE